MKYLPWIISSESTYHIIFNLPDIPLHAGTGLILKIALIIIMTFFFKSLILKYHFTDRNKKKKIPLMTGEEVDMDLSAMEYVKLKI